MAKKRGGQPKHWAEIARVKAWYREVKKWSEWTDYKLDMEFAWTEHAIQSGLQRSAERPRTFEWIRKVARTPRGNDPRWRGMTELVAAVNEHPWLTGTRRLYEAEIWDLLQREGPTPQFVQNRVDSILDAHGLIRRPAEEVASEGSVLVKEFGLPSVFDRCLQLSLHRIDRYSQVALAWLLFVQVEPSRNAHVRVAIEETVDHLLDHFFADFTPNEHLAHYDEAIGVLFRTRLDLSGNGISGYGYLEADGVWPVVPSELLGKLSRKDLGYLDDLSSQGHGPIFCT